MISPTSAQISNCTIIILAAGSASRMGQPKQLLPYNNSTLLGNAIQTATDSGIDQILVVTGAYQSEIGEKMNPANVNFFHNTEWQEGIGSSIRNGLKAALKIWPQTDGVLLMVADQPYVSAALLNSLISLQNSNSKPIVASSYGDTSGTPALFHSRFFTALLALKGDQGARRIINLHEHELSIVPFSAGITDIDTPADYEALRSREGLKKDHD